MQEVSIERDYPYDKCVIQDLSDQLRLSTEWNHSAGRHPL